MARMVTLTIDGLEATVPEGTTILDAAEKVGIMIPTLCHDNRLICSIAYFLGKREGTPVCNMQVYGRKKRRVITKKEGTKRMSIVEQVLCCSHLHEKQKTPSS